MLIGQSKQKVDEKGRLSFPAKFRKDMGESFYVACWLDECLIALPTDRFEQLCEKLSSSGLVKNRALRRMIYSGAEEETPDKMGRILLTADMREHAGITTEAVVIGAGDYAEIWSPDRWQAMNENMRSGPMAEAMEELDI